jgi:AraC-like DNA-binding protein
LAVKVTRSEVDRSPGDILARAPLAPGEQRTVTTNVEVASAAIRAAYGPARLDVRGGDIDLELDLRRFRPIGIELSLVSVGADISVAGSPPLDGYVIVIPVSGTVTVGSRGQVCALSRSTGVVISPGRPVFFTDWSSDAYQFCIRIAQARADSALSLMLRRPLQQRAEFDFRLDLSAQRTVPLIRALELAAAETLEADESHARSVLASSISELVVNSLFLCQEHSYSDAFRKPDIDPDLPRSLQAAQRFVIDHSHQALDVKEIAGAANMSVRGLEKVFARYLHMSPMAYLREVRLVRVHEELCRSTPEQTTVRSVAERWGFHHAGRFSSTYRERFGIVPSEALRTADGDITEVRGGVARPPDGRRRASATSNP